MFKHLMFISMIAMLFSCGKADPIETVAAAETGPNPILKVGDGQSYHTCTMDDGSTGHWCRPAGRNCRNTDRGCRNIDMHGKSQEVSFYTIISTSLDGQDEFELFWNCTYDADFVQEHYDMFMELYNEFDGIHPDEQIEYLNSL